MRFAECADGIRRAATEAGLERNGGGQSGGRAVDLDRWHVASDYQKVVDELRAKYTTYVRSIDSLQEWVVGSGEWGGLWAMLVLTGVVVVVVWT